MHILYRYDMMNFRNCARVCSILRQRNNLNLRGRVFVSAVKRGSTCFPQLYSQIRTNCSVTPVKMAPAPENKDCGFKRLPTDAKPTHYKIYLKPNLATFKFTGKVEIDLKILTSCQSLTLNTYELKVTGGKLKTAGGEKVVTIEQSEKAQTCEIKIGESIAVGNATLTLQFTGTHNDSMQGFYRSKYTLNGKDKFMVSTQFESTDARRAFPCWDEPMFKATFDVTLEVPQDRVALSNMPVKSETKSEDGLKKILYDTTPIMSTYLVAFVVGELEFTEAKTKNGAIVRVYTLPGKTNQGAFALEVCRKSIDFFDDFFNIKYALPKVDCVAIPDFSMGAMENWGLITFREIAILNDPKLSSGVVKQRIALTVSHEVAHMWFGNLVTMEWWTDLWLKEGFASFMEYLFVSKVYPEFNIWLAFLTDEIARAFKLDALKSSHPIEVPIENPNEINEIYDAVSYAKGNSVIRMLYHHLGQDKFQKGVQNYLKKYQYSNAKTVDLWQAFSDASGQNISELMNMWTSAMGFPLLSVNAIQSGKDLKLELAQKHFFADGSEESESDVWQIPMNIVTGANPTNVKQFLMKSAESEFILQNVPENQWIKVNAGVTGYYRVQYNSAMLNKLLPAIKEKKLSVEDRFNLINDIVALIRSGNLSSTQFLNILDASQDEIEYLIWDEIDLAVSALSNILLREPKIKAKFDAFVNKAYAKIIAHVGWEKKTGETHQQTMLRSIVLSRGGKAKNAQVLKMGKQKFEEFVAKKNELDPDLRSLILSMNGRNGDEKTIEALKKLMDATDFSEVRVNCLSAMASCENDKLLPAIMSFGMDSGKVRTQDIHYMFFGMVGWAKGQDFVWKYFKENMDKILKKYGGKADNNIFMAICKLCTQMQSDDAIAREVEDFFSATEYSRVLNRPVRQACENIRLNAAHKKRDVHKIEKWLTEMGF